MRSDLKVGIMGAGAVGCYLGGHLAEAGADVVFVGRARMQAELETAGLTLAAQGGAPPRVVAPGTFGFATEASALGDRDVVLCCVKSAQTAEAGERLASVLQPGAMVVSMQNGVGNADVLRAELTAQTVLGGIVGFNVVSAGSGSFRCATSGPLVIEASSDARVTRLAGALSARGLDVALEPDIRAQQWSKLVMNLNNAVSALSDRPTAELLFTPGYRRILRAIIAEALMVMRAGGVRPARLGALPVGLFPHLLRLPTAVLRVVARAQIKIDPEARSSMWEDLSRGRLTEVEYLNGEIVRLARSSGVSAPLNERVVELVHAAEASGAGSPKLDAEAFWAALTAPSGVAG